jgi:endonuclease
MAIYSKPAWSLMKDMAAALAPAPESIFSKQQAIDWFSKNYPKIKTGTVTAHLIRLSTNAQTRTHYNAKPGQDDVFFQLDGSHFRLYQPTQDPSPIYTAREPNDRAQNPEEEEREESGDSSGSGQFAYETDLRNYLAKNLSLIEPGLRLYEDEGITGIEFPVGGRFIDILATDSTGGLVVIELKVSRGYDRVVGQLMRYMAWICKNQADSSQRVRGVIVAREISEDLLLACSVVPDVELFEYQLSLSLKRVDRDRRA